MFNVCFKDSNSNKTYMTITGAEVGTALNMQGCLVIVSDMNLKTLEVQDNR